MSELGNIKNTNLLAEANHGAKAKRSGWMAPNKSSRLASGPLSALKSILSVKK